MSNASKQMRQLHEDVLAVSKELMATDNYIEKYLPFEQLNLIFDMGKETSSLKQYGKLQTFLEQKYEDLEELVRVDDGKAKLNKKTYNKQTLDMDRALPLNRGEF
jgi:phosphorylcholine metabolism protein LicD